MQFFRNRCFKKKVQGYGLKQYFRTRKHNASHKQLRIHLNEYSYPTTCEAFSDEDLLCFLTLPMEKKKMKQLANSGKPWMALKYFIHAYHFRIKYARYVSYYHRTLLYSFLTGSRTFFLLYKIFQCITSNRINGSSKLT